MPSADEQVALDTAIAALHAIGNLTMALLVKAQDAGLPDDQIRDALEMFHRANEAVISQEDSKKLLAGYVKLALKELEPSGH